MLWPVDLPPLQTRLLTITQDELTIDAGSIGAAGLSSET